MKIHKLIKFKNKKYNDRYRKFLEK
jgi:hypothetical protein